MFQFRAFPPYGYLIHHTVHRYCLCGFPHSDISGSSLICSSPKLFAACRVLHRLLMPRHSPCALISLTFQILSRLRWALDLSWFSFRIMQAQQKCLTKLYLPLIKVSTMLFVSLFLSEQPLCCLAFSLPLFSFQGASSGFRRWWRIAGSNR